MQCHKTTETYGTKFYRLLFIDILLSAKERMISKTAVGYFTFSWWLVFCCGPVDCDVAYPEGNRLLPSSGQGIGTPETLMFLIIIYQTTRCHIKLYHNLNSKEAHVFKNELFITQQLAGCELISVTYNGYKSNRISVKIGTFYWIKCQTAIVKKCVLQR